MKFLTFLDKHAIMAAVITCTVVFYFLTRVGEPNTASTIPIELSLIAGFLIYDVHLVVRKVKERMN